MGHTITMQLLESNASCNNHVGPGRMTAEQPIPGSVDRHLRTEIVALIPRLRRWARVLTRDVVAADDLVQDCLTRALEKSHLWIPGTDLRAWLFTMLYRRHVSHVRRRVRHDTIETQELSPSLVCPPDQSARLELRDLQRALAKLPEQQRSVILLVGLEGMGYEEAASVVNVPVGTIRSRVARGRESLRTMTGLFPTRHSARGGKAATRSFPRPAAVKQLRHVSQQIASVRKKEVVQ
jgi:RNA polymerase sigma-70 factor (ECF subfamily)